MSVFSAKTGTIKVNMICDISRSFLSVDWKTNVVQGEPNDHSAITEADSLVALRIARQHLDATIAARQAFVEGT